MNLVLFEEHELQTGGLLVLSDVRAEHIRKVLGLLVDDSLRIGMINGTLGRGTVLSIDAEAVTLAVQLDREPPPLVPVELILALPRPIMLQRILKQAATIGVGRIHLLRSAKVEKSFFHSPALLPEKIRERLLEGLAQATVDTRLPEVCIHPLFKVFVQDALPELEGCRLLAHPGVLPTLPEVFPRSKERILLAVGPEGGWNDYEVSCFLEQGFAAFAMGSRILHVDTAVAVLLGQLALLRTLTAG
ncbi:MAG: RNA methyltransferase, RsmE family [Candidatus Electronema aureum]|uniref:Ribosomal RNA small subunit methyltransferase E n=1 Tax=Candidatus Electronema aureum TaxID=2005002 RepID=A0A521G347_9BACT|nr:MAG: RNA methyltransferase, RsmE family [Candidatus Electronema aureum]